MWLHCGINGIDGIDVIATDAGMRVGMWVGYVDVTVGCGAAVGADVESLLYVDSYCRCWCRL